MYTAWDKSTGKDLSAFTNYWMGKQVIEQFHKIDADLLVIFRYKKYLKDKAVIAAFKKNSSFFMRRTGDPVIFKREGVTGENVLDYIIMCGKMLDDMDCKSDYYIPVAPHWFEDAVDPL